MNQLKNQFNKEFSDKPKKEPKEGKNPNDEIQIDTLNKLPERTPDEQDLMSSRLRGQRDFHNHNGINSEPISIENLRSFIETVTAIPTLKPRRFYEQFKIYMDSVTAPTDTRLYIYSFEANTWNFYQLNGLAGTKVYYVSDSSGGAVTRKLTFTNGVLTAET